jgi:hypothetical protein
MQDTKHSDIGMEGTALGLIAGIVFGVMQIIAATVAGESVLFPIRLFASVALGPDAFETTSVARVLIAGNVVHLALSALFGFVYVQVNDRLPLADHMRRGRQALIGLLFGALLWGVAFQVIARLWYPWFLQTNQLVQLVMHSVFFGLPLGLLYAGFERKVEHARASVRP